MNKKEKNLLQKFAQRKKAVATEEVNIKQQELDLKAQHLEKSIHKLTDADMPAIETLNEESDYSMFMSNKVSAVLKKKALRKLFLSPSINILDKLNDYDEDYTSFASLGDIVTYDLKQELKREAEEIQEKILATQKKAIKEQEQTQQEQTQQEAVKEQEKNKNLQKVNNKKNDD